MKLVESLAGRSSIELTISDEPLIYTSLSEMLEKRIQCHIQATNKFPTKLGLIIERAQPTSAKTDNTRLKTIANPK